MGKGEGEELNYLFLVVSDLAQKHGESSLPPVPTTTLDYFVQLQGGQILSMLSINATLWGSFIKK